MLQIWLPQRLLQIPLRLRQLQMLRSRSRLSLRRMQTLHPPRLRLMLFLLISRTTRMPSSLIATPQRRLLSRPLQFLLPRRLWIPLRLKQLQTPLLRRLQRPLRRRLQIPPRLRLRQIQKPLRTSRRLTARLPERCRETRLSILIDRNPSSLKRLPL